MSGFGTKSQKGDKDKKPVVESVVSDFEEPAVPVTAPVAETAPPVIQEKVLEQQIAAPVVQNQIIQQQAAPMPKVEKTPMTEQKKVSGVTTLLSKLARPVLSSGTLSGNLFEFREAIEKVLKEPSVEQAGFKFYMNTDETHLAAPAIAIYKQFGGKVFYFALLPQACVNKDRLQDFEEYVNNVKVTVDMPASKVVDDVYRQTMARHLSHACQVPVENVVFCHYYSISEDKQLKDEDVVVNAFNTAILAITERCQPSEIPSAELLKADDLSLSLKNDILPGSTYIMGDGERVAADAIVKLVAQSKQKTRGSVNNGEGILVLSKIAVQLQLLKFDQRRYNQAYSQMGAMGYMQPSPGYHRLLVITGSEAVQGGIESPSTSALGILSLCQMATGENSMSLFNATPVGPKRLGVLGYDYEPFPVPLAPKEVQIESGYMASQQGNMTVNDMAKCYFYPGVRVAIDIKDGGRSSWTQQLWLAIAMGNTAANLAMIGIFDAITGNHFSALWNKGNYGLLADQATTTVHNGHFVDAQSGEKHDIREIETTYLYDTYKENCPAMEQQLLDYMYSFAPGATAGNEGMQRLHLRRQNIKSMEPSAVINGLSTRVFLNKDLMAVAAQALVNAGVKFSPEGLFDQAANAALMQAYVGGTAIDFALGAQLMAPNAVNSNGQQAYTHQMFATGFGQPGVL